MCPTCRERDEAQRRAERIPQIERELWVSMVLLGILILVLMVVLPLMDADVVRSRTLVIVTAGGAFSALLLAAAAAFAITRATGFVWVGFAAEVLLLGANIGLVGMSLMTFVLFLLPGMTFMRMASLIQLRSASANPPDGSGDGARPGPAT